MSRRRRIALVLALWVLAPWTAECSWGGFALSDYLLVVVFLSPLYGAAAVLIREAVRRTGRGWPAIALMGAAFGIYQAGIVDQALFNLDYLADTEYADLIRDPRATLLPGIEVSAGDALNYIGNHIVLSICVPIAIVESFVAPDRRREPWLGPVGLAVVGVLFVLGSLLIHSDAVKGYSAEPYQLAFAATLVVALIGLALWPRSWPPSVAWRLPRPVAWSRPERRAPRAFWSAVVTLAAAATADLVPGWGGVAINVLAIVIAVVVIVRWSHRPGWTHRHVLAAFSGPLVLAAAGAYVVPNYAPASPTEALIGDLTITVVTVALLGSAFYRLRHEEAPTPTPAASAAG
ncbi:hypothetical protein [Cryptosporangium aurantiacum]|uniref:Uncharacterized protein n=1 Tax=Cryptosporangium aurantiacum TaxID=134849 RepID=A0A1M7RDD6_9ACTN|nr:hypothetical protein [Cryptosporangium aurantiacum]SHN44313.1 hypothetical protein SAMN05443668_110159 [Cryptosporangium aurantiacum]